VDGPFELLDLKTRAQINGKAVLHGTFTQWRLDKAKTDLLKVQAVGKMVGKMKVAMRKSEEDRDRMERMERDRMERDRLMSSSVISSNDGLMMETASTASTRVRKRDLCKIRLLGMFKKNRAVVERPPMGERALSPLPIASASQPGPRLLGSERSQSSGWPRPS